MSSNIRVFVGRNQLTDISNHLQKLRPSYQLVLPSLMADAYSKGRGPVLEVCHSGDSELKDHISNASGTNVISNSGSDLLGTIASAEDNINRLLASKVKLVPVSLQDDGGDGYKGIQGHEEDKTQIRKETRDSDENSEQTKVKEASLKGGADVCLGHIKSYELSQHVEKHKSHTRKVAPTQKLWDGCLQLNSSVTFSAVAFFKSGEKMPDVKWSESVEVKGKVKLDAFEKYIQDLSRSRNRGLMVVSLRWKEGSAKTGLLGMKKVAKGYKEGNRVGLAQLSPGIDLYVCPRSETIITILAKHGFFKGMTAIEENKDSLIGCVVWRRNQINLKSVEQKSERCRHQVSVSNVPPSHLPRKSKVPSERNNTALEATPKDKYERDTTESKIPPVSNNSETQSGLRTSLSVRMEAKTSHPDPANLHVPVGQSSKSESPPMDWPVEKQQEVSLELLQPVSVFPTGVAKHSSTTFDPASEDLPEYDFGIPCGVISQAFIDKAFGSLAAEKRPSDKGRGDNHVSLPPTVSIPKSWPASYQRIDKNLHCAHPFINPQEMPPQKKVCRYDNRAMRMPPSTHVALSKKNLFDDDDDDDMPEWCPPDLNLERQSVLASNQSSSSFLIHSNQSKLMHPFLSSAAQNPLPSSAFHPPIYRQTTHFGFHSPANTLKQPQPRPTLFHVAKGPSSSMAKGYLSRNA